MLEIDENKLLPCPFCGYEKIRIVVRPYEKILNMPKDYFCQCWGCGCALNSNITKESAIERWNTRIKGDQDARD